MKNKNIELKWERGKIGYTINLNECIGEFPLFKLRWLIKQDNTKILQQAFERVTVGGKREIIYKDIEEVK